ncbi:MAG: hypothetical protein KGJ56_08215 [Gammaproteobacteria bacterium]|nr:hypothetical protein [Gammaproteobacteria bacterium]
MDPQTPMAGFRQCGRLLAGSAPNCAAEAGTVVFVFVGAIVAAVDGVRNVIALKKL